MRGVVGWLLRLTWLDRLERASGLVAPFVWSLRQASSLRVLGSWDGAFWPVPLGLPIWMDNVDCVGTESRLVDCPFIGFGTHNCVHLEDVGAFCSGCPASPSPSCTGGFGKAVLSIKEPGAGRGSMKLRLAKGPSLTTAELGSPMNLFFESSYSVCVYDDGGALAGQMLVPGSPDDMCGTKPCWKELGPNFAPKGFRYRDPALSQDGIVAMVLKSGLAGKSSVLVRGRNNPKLGIVNLPSMTSALAGSTSATVQFFTDEGGCFEATLTDVSRNDVTSFRARQ